MGGVRGGTRRRAGAGRGAQRAAAGEEAPSGGVPPALAPEEGAQPAPVTPWAHTPVLLEEVLVHLAPPAGGTVLDATVGGGGHAAALLRALGPGGLLVGLDRDPRALAAAQERLAPLAQAQGVQLRLVRANFADLAAVLAALGIGPVHGVLFDLGVSSPQLDEAERGFSYRYDAPLDMRMDPEQPISAYHLVNGLSEGELVRLLRQYGEERWAERIAACVVRYRQQRGLIATTGELTEIVKQAIPAAARRSGGHPARRTFQALRIAVNRELDALEAGLRQAVEVLAPGGRVVAISFHSLEDRIVKRVFRELARACLCPPGWPVCRCGHRAQVVLPVVTPITPRPEELQGNPRARSAKLRVAIRLAADAAAPARRAGGASAETPPAPSGGSAAAPGNGPQPPWNPPGPVPDAAAQPPWPAPLGVGLGLGAEGGASCRC